MAKKTEIVVRLHEGELIIPFEQIVKCDCRCAKHIEMNVNLNVSDRSIDTDELIRKISERLKNI